MPNQIPFIQKAVSPKVGLNPLGMQNACITAYTDLLPGLNNVTNRIRYYSMYCWLLDKFFYIYPEAEEEEQIDYIRKSEYLLALISVHNNDVGGVPGVLYAKAIKEEHVGDTWTIDLVKGSDFRKKERDENGRLTYWKQKGGAFRQYYASVLTDMGLITLPYEKKGYVYSCTSSQTWITGKMLSDIISSGVPSDVQKIFIDCIKKGTVSKDELEMLGSDFDMNNIHVSVEKEILTQLLFENDYPTDYENNTEQRKQTLYYFLSFISDRDEEGRLHDYEFTTYMYDLYHANSNEEDVVIGWASYHINEMWQFNSLCLFSSMLDYLNLEVANEWLDIDTLVDIYTQRICDEFAEVLGLSKQTKLSDIAGVTLYVECPLDSDSDAYYMYQILALYFDNKEKFESLSKYSNYLYGDERADFVAIMKKFNDTGDESLERVIYTYMYNEIIYRHYTVAFTKLAQTNIATHKFSIQDHKIRMISTYSPSHTSPRIRNLTMFLSDLDILDNYTITSKGASILKDMSNERV